MGLFFNKLTIKLSGAFLMAFFINSCSSEISETIISSTSFDIETKVVFLLDPPLERKNNSASIRMQLDENWEPLPPWESIKLMNGSFAVLRAVLLSNDGKVFKSSLLGQAGEMLNIRFQPEVPKNVLFNKLILYSDTLLTCNKLLWHDFDVK